MAKKTRQEPVELKIITGMSGAGKTQAIQVLEDLGYYCVDNLPPNLFMKFAEIVARPGDQMPQVALVVDARGGKFFLDLYGALAQLKERGVPYQIIFLEASDEVLVRRFKETRRRHPLSSGGMTILSAIDEERKRLENIRGIADIIIDTSNTTTQQLKEKLLAVFSQDAQSSLWVSVVSFGYKYGLPIDADLVMDVRFLPNPYYIQELRPLSGQDEPVRQYVMESKATQDFLTRYKDLLVSLLPLYAKEGKKHLSIAIGCTGGRHRSVAIADCLGQELSLIEGLNCQVAVNHRDINKY